MAGFAGACGLVLMLALLNPGMMSPEQVQRTLGEFVIGLIPITESKSAPHDYVLERPNSGLVEAINTLKFSLALSDPDRPVKAVQVTSSVPEEGKTTLALALARVVAASGQKVVVVDGDLRRSSIGRKLNIREKHKGLSDLVVAGEETDLREFLLRDEPGKLDFMPTGTAKYANATDIFSSHRMQTIINRLKAEYDLVVIDTPPVMAVADARIIGRVVDKTQEGGQGRGRAVAARRGGYCRRRAAASGPEPLWPDGVRRLRVLLPLRAVWEILFGVIAPTPFAAL
jgi:capsular exopolysaccharide synthesis family protein